MMLLVTVAALSFGQEDFRVEVTGLAWSAGIEGDVQAGGFPVDLRQDLDLEDRWTFFGKLTVKPGRRHRLFVEGSPNQFSGRNTVSRTFEFAGETYVLQEDVESRAEMTYVFGGYQFDFVSRSRGHLGVLAGVGYVDATGEVTAVARGITGREQESFPLPLVGIGGRGWIVPGRVSVSGEIKGMSLGRYGRFIQGRVDGGLTFGPVTVLGGWQVLDADIHEEGGESGIRPRISGPVVGLQARW